MKSLVVVLFLLSGIIVNFSAFAAEWDSDPNNWLMSGVNCPTPDQIDVISSVDELQISLDDTFKLDLSSATDPLLAWSYCTFVIKADLQPGDYVPLMSQEFTYSYAKTSNSLINVASVGSFFGTPMNINVAHGVGEVTTGTDSIAAGVAVGNSPFPNVGSCLGLEDKPGLYMFTLAMSVQRFNTGEAVTVELNKNGDGVNHKTRVEIMSNEILCPHVGGSI